LHTLEGLHALSFEFLKKVAAIGEPMLTAHALVLLQKYSAGNNVKAMEALITDLLNKNNATINLYLALSLGPWNEVSNGTFLPILEKISETYPDKALYQEAIVNSLKGWENNFQKIISKAAPQKSAILDTLLAETITNKREGKMNSIYVQVKTPPDARTNGLAIFRSTCATCHGVDGDGIEHVAPPLKSSEYVEGSPDRLALIILNGLEGPIHINGKLYNFNGTMPNFANNYTDKDITDVIEYLHNAYVTKPVKSIHADKIKELRNKKSGTLEEKDLLEMTNLSN
jgi:mono/diheme cytochrome c family protein